jgi:hypothetical protein
VPSLRARQVVVPGMLRHSRQNRRGFAHGDLAWAWSGGVAQEASLGEWADRPLEVRRVAPGRYEWMVHVIFGEQRDEDIDGKQVAGFRQPPPRFPSLSPG